MFRSAARQTLRRCLHTSSARSTTNLRFSRDFGIALGATTVLAGTLVWNSQSRIALDSAGHSSKPPTTSSTELSTPPEGSTSSPSLKLTTEGSPSPQSEPELSTPNNTAVTDSSVLGPEEEDTVEGGGGAFNPVTGEINWDCPCLGGMAHGICGAQFREAFSCFVFSEKEPKGIDCVEKFKLMQDCFREHPDVYGDDIMDDDDDDEDIAPAVDDGSLPTTPSTGNDSSAFEPTPSPSPMYTRADPGESSSTNSSLSS